MIGWHSGRAFPDLAESDEDDIIAFDNQITQLSPSEQAEHVDGQAEIRPPWASSSSMQWLWAVG